MNSGPHCNHFLVDQNREKGDLGQKQRQKCDSNPPKDPLRNSAGVKHLKRKMDLFKDGYKNLLTVLSNFEGKVSPQSLMKGNHSCIIYLSLFHFCRLATAAAVLPSSYAAYSVLILDSGDHCHGRAQSRSLRGEQRSKQVCSSIWGYIPNT